MISDSGRTVSAWMSVPMPAFPALAADARADVCVIGAGISGLTTAYLLTEAGRSVIVLENGDIASGATGRTTAHLSNAFDDRYYEVERLHGAERAQLVAQSHTAAIDRIEAIVTKEGIDCDFARVDGYLFCQPNDSPDVLKHEFEAATRAGLCDVGLASAGPFETFDTGPCLRFPRQAQFHPLKYLAAIAARVAERGGRIYTTTHAADITGDGPMRISTRQGASVTADAVVIATNSPVSSRFVLHTKQAAYRTYAVGLRVPRASVPRVLAWDTGDPYHYIRTAPLDDASDLLIVGGEDHKTGQADDTEESFRRLELWARQCFPAALDAVYRWSGQIMEPVDYLAYIGRNPLDSANTYVVTGDSGNGMTHGTIGGMLVADLILGRDNPWAELYAPNRKRLRAARDFTSENANVVAQYRAWVTPGEVSSMDAIPRGSGAVMRRGLHKIAVYRDDAGAVHACKATCPHLGCIVEWNNAERTWDCPCHGSRFDAYGRVINGPANVDLTSEADIKKTG